MDAQCPLSCFVITRVPLGSKCLTTGSPTACSGAGETANYQWTFAFLLNSLNIFMAVKCAYNEIRPFDPFGMPGSVAWFSLCGHHCCPGFSCLLTLALCTPKYEFSFPPPSIIQCTIVLRAFKKMLGLICHSSVASEQASWVVAAQRGRESLSLCGRNVPGAKPTEAILA